MKKFDFNSMPNYETTIDNFNVGSGKGMLKNLNVSMNYGGDLTNHYNDLVLGNKQIDIFGENIFYGKNIDYKINGKGDVSIDSTKVNDLDQFCLPLYNVLNKSFSSGLSVAKFSYKTFSLLEAYKLSRKSKFRDENPYQFSSIGVSINKNSNGSEYEFGEKSVKNERQILLDVDRTDDAFLNSILSYACYEDNEWILKNLNKDVSEIKPKIKEAILSDDFKEVLNVKLWNFCKDKFEPVSANELFKTSDNKVEIEHSSLDYQYSTKTKYCDGFYDSLDGLAHATVMKSKHPDGGYVLHVAYRGTDFNRLPDYIKKAYLDMQAYHDSFDPLNQAVQDYIKDPKNNIKEVQFSGHSLGGYVASETLRQFKEDFTGEGPKITGFTYGSPGVHKNKFLKFLTSVYHFATKFKFIKEPVFQKDNRLTEYYHNTDPVPKLGALGYKKTGERVELFDRMFDDNVFAKVEESSKIKRVFNIIVKEAHGVKDILSKLMDDRVKFHNSDRYAINLLDIVDAAYEAHPELKEQFDKKTINYQQFKKSENDLSALIGIIDYQIRSELKEEENISYEFLQPKIKAFKDKINFNTESAYLIAKNINNQTSFDSENDGKNWEYSHELATHGQQGLSMNLGVEHDDLSKYYKVNFKSIAFVRNKETLAMGNSKNKI